MPYITCESCGLPGFVSRGWLEAPECPNCGHPIVRAVETAPKEVIDGSLALLRGVLEMDMAMVTEIREGGEVVRQSSGDWPGIDDLGGEPIPLAETYCRRMLEGLIGNVVPDVSAEESLRDLEMTRQLGIGAWIGTPIHVSHARLYILCCLAREARPDLGDREVRVLEGFARSVLDQLERSEG